MRNPIILGTAQFGQAYGIANLNGQPTLDCVRSILLRALGNGICALDTAIAYGNSEQILGKVGIQEFRIISKLPSIPESEAQDVSTWVDAQVMGSLARLNIDTLDGLLLHRPEQLLSPIGEQLYQALQEQIMLGRVRQIGVSIYDPTELDLLIPKFDLDIVQAPLNILDARLGHSGWLDRLRGLGIALHTRSVFLQGLLLMHADQRPPYFNRWASLWDTWSSWLNEHQLTPLQACLRYALYAEGVEQVVLGVDSESQLAEIVIAAEEGPLPDGYQALQTQDPELLNPSLWNLK